MRLSVTVSGLPQISYYGWLWFGVNYLLGSSPGTGRVSYFTSALSVRWSYVYHNRNLYNESSWAGYRFHGISWFENVMASEPLIFSVVIFLQKVQESLR